MSPSSTLLSVVYEDGEKSSERREEVALEMLPAYVRTDFEEVHGFKREEDKARAREFISSFRTHIATRFNGTGRFVSFEGHLVSCNEALRRLSRNHAFSVMELQPFRIRPPLGWPTYNNSTLYPGVMTSGKNLYDYAAELVVMLDEEELPEWNAQRNCNKVEIRDDFSGEKERNDAIKFLGEYKAGEKSGTCAH